MPAGTALVSFHDARGFILSRVSLIAPQVVPLADALGKPLSERVIATVPIPSHPLAGRRGIAVASLDLVGASPYSPVFLSSRPVAVVPGDPLPPPTDAVLEEDALVSSLGSHEVGQSAYPGEGAVLTGADCPEGTEIAMAGATVTSTVLLALSLSGMTTVAVRSPIVHLSNPDDTAPAEASWLRSALVEAGCRPVSHGDSDIRLQIVRDPYAAAATSSKGQTFSGLALNPGRDTVMTWDNDRPTVVLASRFDAVAAAFYALLLPAIADMTGRRLRLIERPLTDKVVSQVGFADISLLRSTEAGYEPQATGVLSLEALIKADAVGIVGPESEGAPAGARFSAIPIKDPFEAP